jgi:predicted nucleic acid-binding protein
MSARVFLDNDVILDLILRREPFFAAAADLFSVMQDGSIEACVSPLSFSNLAYVLGNQSAPNQVIGALRKLRLIVRVLPVDEKILDLALSSTFKDFEDAIQYYTAVTNGLEAVVTRNKRDYREAKLPILDARECCEQFGA